MYTSVLQLVVRGVVNYPSIFLSPIVSSLLYQSIGINQLLISKTKNYVFRQ